MSGKRAANRPPIPSRAYNLDIPPVARRAVNRRYDPNIPPIVRRQVVRRYDPNVPPIVSRPQVAFDEDGFDPNEFETSDLAYDVGTLEKKWKFYQDQSTKVHGSEGKYNEQEVAAVDGHLVYWQALYYYKVREGLRQALSGDADLLPDFDANTQALAQAHVDLKRALKERLDFQARRRVVPRLVAADEKELGFEPGWYPDPLQLEWNAAAAEEYFKRRLLLYQAELQKGDWGVEGDSGLDKQQVTVYVELYLAGTLALRAMWLAMQKNAEAGKQLKLACARVAEWFPRAEDLAPAPQGFDPRWYDYTMLHAKASAVQVPLQATEAKEVKTPAEQSQKNIQVAVWKALYAFAYANENKSMVNDKKSQEANDYLRALCIAPLTDSPTDVTSIVMSLAATEEPVHKKRRVESKALSEQEKTGQTRARQFRDLVYQSRVRLKKLRLIAEPEDAVREEMARTQKNIQTSIQEIRQILDEFKDKWWITEFSEFRPLPADAIDVDAAQQTVVRERELVPVRWKAPDDAKYSEAEWSRSRKDDEAVLRQLETQQMADRRPVQPRASQLGLYPQWLADDKEWQKRAKQHNKAIVQLKTLMKLKAARDAFNSGLVPLPEINPFEFPPEFAAFRTLRQIEVQIEYRDTYIAELERERDSPNQQEAANFSAEALQREQLHKQQLENYLQQRAPLRPLPTPKPLPTPSHAPAFEPADRTVIEVDSQSDEDLYVPRRRGSALAARRNRSKSTEDAAPAVVIQEENKDAAPFEQVEQNPALGIEDDLEHSQDKDFLQKYEAIQAKFAKLMGAYYVMELQRPDEPPYFNGTRFVDEDRFQAFLADSDLAPLVTEAAALGLTPVLTTDNFIKWTLDGTNAAQPNKMPKEFRIGIVEAALRFYQKADQGKKEPVFFKGKEFTSAKASTDFQNIEWLYPIFADLTNLDVYFKWDAQKGLAPCTKAVYDQLEDLDPDYDSKNDVKELDVSGAEPVVVDPQAEAQKAKVKKKVRFVDHKASQQTIAHMGFLVNESRVAAAWRTELDLVEHALAFADGEVLQSHPGDKTQNNPTAKRQTFTQQYALLLWSSRVVDNMQQIMESTPKGYYRHLRPVFDWFGQEELPEATLKFLRKRTDIGNDRAPTLKDGLRSGWFRTILSLHMAFVQAIRLNDRDGLKGELLKHVFITDKLAEQAEDNNLAWWLENLGGVYAPRKLNIDEMGLQVMLVLALLDKRFYGFGFPHASFNKLLAFFGASVYWSLRLFLAKKTTDQGPTDLRKQPWFLGAWIAMKYMREFLSTEQPGFFPSVFSDYRKYYVRSDIAERQAKKDKKGKDEKELDVSYSILAVFASEDSQTDMESLNDLLDSRLPKLLHDMLRRPARNKPTSKKNALRDFDDEQSAELKETRQAIEDAKDINLSKVPKSDAEGREEWTTEYEKAITFAPELAGQVLSMSADATRRVDRAVVTFSEVWDTGMASLVATPDLVKAHKADEDAKEYDVPWKDTASNFEETLNWRALKFRLVYNWLKLIFSFAPQPSNAAPPAEKKERKRPEAKSSFAPPPPPAPAVVVFSSAQRGVDALLDGNEYVVIGDESPPAAAAEPATPPPKTWQQEFDELGLPMVRHELIELQTKQVSGGGLDLDDVEKYDYLRKLYKDKLVEFKRAEIAKWKDRDEPDTFTNGTLEEQDTVLHSFPRRIRQELRSMLEARLYEREFLKQVHKPDDDKTEWKVSPGARGESKAQAQKLIDAHRRLLDFQAGDVRITPEFLANTRAKVTQALTGQKRTDVLRQLDVTDEKKLVELEKLYEKIQAPWQFDVGQVIKYRLRVIQQQRDYGEFDPD